MTCFVLFFLQKSPHPQWGRKGLLGQLWQSRTVEKCGQLNCARKTICESGHWSISSARWCEGLSSKTTQGALKRIKPNSLVHENQCFGLVQQMSTELNEPLGFSVFAQTLLSSMQTNFAVVLGSLRPQPCPPPDVCALSPWKKIYM